MATETPPDESAPGSNAIHVLVVDDSEFFAEMTAETLANEHEMVTHDVNDVDEAKAYLSDTRVDCIVSDYEMPGEDGLAFLEWVHDNFDALPFILLTGRGDEEIASEAIAGGVADYLLKLEVVEDNQYGRLANRIRSVVDQQRTEQKYQHLVENTPDAVAHVGESGEILSANDALADLAGTSSDALAGANLQSVLGEDVGQEWIETGRKAIEHGEATKAETVYRGRHVHNIFVPMDDRSPLESFQLISRDITAQKERERELRRQNERLETFASVVTHDLRNPLNVAASSLELLEPEVGDTDEYDRITRSLERMDDLIDDVLMLARHGEHAHDPEDVSLQAVAEDAWANVDGEVATVEVVSTATIHADRGQLQELLENLVANAIEHAGPDITVEVGVLDGGFYVADDGPGIDPSARETVFELGYSTNAAGTGMGLAIVEQIADAHDWSATVTDSESGGARFEFTDVDSS